MRWDNLTIESERDAALPGFKEPAVVRTFDAPEALGTRFYEVRARSAINEVPKRSRMPFRYTINAYRGCAHACTYCLSGETPILMADGSTRPLEKLRPGDMIYGTAREGWYRRYTVTPVINHWGTTKSAYRVTLEDGTELVASGDHRFLTNRGWKHVTDADQGSPQRAHLTLNNKLIGTGGFATSPVKSPDYQRGYLCGLIRGDGHIGSYTYERAGRSSGDVHRFRLALADFEALRRARDYLSRLGVETDEFQFVAASVAASRRPMRAIRTQSKPRIERIKAVIEWPGRASEDWVRGFLAGIFDAEGSWSGCIRISNTDPLIIDWITWGLTHLGFRFLAEDPGRSNGIRVVRIRGGLRENLRFFHAVDPVISRKRSIEGVALKSDAKLGVASIEPMGRQALYDITTGTGDFIANGVVSHNCFARPTHTYLDFNAREDFEREIVVKVNVPELVRAELARPSWRGEHVALGTNTDPYQWVEGRYKLMRGIWEAMRDFANPCSVLTKSPLLLRDLDLMKEIAERTDFTANLSIPTLDEKAWRDTEPHTPHPRNRIEAVAELKRAGIRTGVLIAPLIPGVNDSPQQVEPLLQLLDEAGADSIGGVALHLRGEVRDIWFDWLRERRPDLLPRYDELFARGAYMRKDEASRLSAMVRRPGKAGPRRGIRKEPAVQVRREANRPPEREQRTLF
jgi:DNA repair photolyase